MHIELVIMIWFYCNKKTKRPLKLFVGVYVLNYIRIFLYKTWFFLFFWNYFIRSHKKFVSSTGFSNCKEMKLYYSEIRINKIKIDIIPKSKNHIFLQQLKVKLKPNRLWNNPMKKTPDFASNLKHLLWNRELGHRI